MFGTNVGY